MPPRFCAPSDQRRLVAVLEALVGLDADLEDDDAMRDHPTHGMTGGEAHQVTAGQALETELINIHIEGDFVDSDAWDESRHGPMPIVETHVIGGELRHGWRVVERPIDTPEAPPDPVPMDVDNDATQTSATFTRGNGNESGAGGDGAGDDDDDCTALAKSAGSSTALGQQWDDTACQTRPTALVDDTACKTRPTAMVDVVGNSVVAAEADIASGDDVE